MKFSTFVTALAGVEAVLAARFTQQRRERHANRVAQRGKGHPKMPGTDRNGHELQGDAAVNETYHTTYSQNWAGAVLVGTGYTAVVGTFVVPTPKTPAGGSTATAYGASAWVGIDGATTTNSILQTGLDFYVQGNGIAFDAWYEWYPDYAYDFSGIYIAPGDTVTISVVASTTTGGTATVKNVSRGTSVSHTFSAQPALSRVNAEWIVEDFQMTSGLVPFANFGTVAFTNCAAAGSAGVVSPAGATMLDIKQGGTILTNSVTSGSTITVTHT